MAVLNPTTKARNNDGQERGLRATPSRLRLVELFGLPGCGKSTLATELAVHLECLTRNDISARWAMLPIRKKGAHIARGLFDRRTAIAAIGFAISARLTSTESLFRLFRLVAKRDWVCRQQGTVLLDQGFLQDIWSILYEAQPANIRTKAISRLVSALYRDIDPSFLYLELNSDTAATRIFNRSDGSSRLDQLPEEKIRIRLEKRNWISQQIVLAAIASGLEPSVLTAADASERVLDTALARFKVQGVYP